MEQKGYVYFMTNGNNNVLYVGVTDSLKRRMVERSEGRGSEFTKKYNCSKLVYYEGTSSMKLFLSTHNLH